MLLTTAIGSFSKFHFQGGELFAKRRKKADKWVVEEGSLRSNPSQLADQFLVQQDFQQQDYQVNIESDLDLANNVYYNSTIKEQVNHIMNLYI